MVSKKDSNKARLQRHKRVRAKISGTPECPRLDVFRSARHIYAQIISADGKNVLCAASTLEPEVRAQLAGVTGKGGNVNAAKLIGTRIAEKAKAAGIESCAFDRAGYRFHGRIAALANAAREAGLKF